MHVKALNTYITQIWQMYIYVYKNIYVCVYMTVYVYVYIYACQRRSKRMSFSNVAQVPLYAYIFLDDSAYVYI